MDILNKDNSALDWSQSFGVKASFSSLNDEFIFGDNHKKMKLLITDNKISKVQHTLILVGKELPIVICKVQRSKPLTEASTQT